MNQEINENEFIDILNKIYRSSDLQDDLIFYFTSNNTNIISDFKTLLFLIQKIISTSPSEITKKWARNKLVELSNSLEKEDESISN